MTPDILAVFSPLRQKPLTGNSQRWVTHPWCLEMDDCARHTCLIPSSLLFNSLQRLFPEKLSSCQWLPVVSEAVVKRPCVRLALATITTAVIVVLAVFNLVRAKRGLFIQYTMLFAELQSMLSSGCLSVKFLNSNSLSPCSASSRQVWLIVPVMLIIIPLIIIPLNKN